MTIRAVVFDAYGTLYDVQSAGRIVDAAFPGHGETITQIWRLKQLEYSWLRSMMGRYEDFARVTREALSYTLEALGLAAEPALFDRIVGAYETLAAYDEVEEALTALKAYRLAILSNGSPNMLDALVRNSGLGHHFHSIISVDAKRAYKPDPRAYELVQERLGTAPEDVLLVSSNGFDVAGARAFGFTVARIERVAPAALRQELQSTALIGPAALFRALRSQAEALDLAADAVVTSLLELPRLLSGLLRR